jgi:quercetin dioxygenase-like cupin family protein
VTQTPRPIFVDGCVQVVVGVVKGKVSLGKDALAETDLAIVEHPNGLKLTGDGAAFVAHVQLTHAQCEGDAGGAIQTRIVHGAGTKKLQWANGKMSAWLDVGPETSKLVYAGRLVGTAPVAEHVHKDSWEVICALEASGTFTLDGKDQKLGPKQVVVVPPNTKHAWKPDDGSTLRAIQLYVPRGPEERFKGLAGANPNAADGGAK